METSVYSAKHSVSVVLRASNFEIIFEEGEPCECRFYIEAKDLEAAKKKAMEDLLDSLEDGEDVKPCPY
jgi:hypothetical protein